MITSKIKIVLIKITAESISIVEVQFHRVDFRGKNFLNFQPEIV